MKLLWIFSEVCEEWPTDNIFACTTSKDKAQETWDSLAKKEGKNGMVYEYTVIDLETEQVLTTIGRYTVIKERHDYHLN